VRKCLELLKRCCALESWTPQSPAPQLVATALRTAVAPFLIRISNSSRQHVEAERMKVVAELVD